MVFSIGGSNGRVISFLENHVVNSNGSSPVALDPAGLVSPDFRLTSLGSPRQIGAAMAIMNRDVMMEMQRCREPLGETDRNVVEGIERYIGHGDLSDSHPNDPIGASLRKLHAEDSEQTPHSRMRTILDAALPVLDAARGPGLNLLNIVGRTGLIVAITTVLREVVAYHVEQALREGDSTEASRAWAVAAMTMIGPALTLVGAIRSERDGTASPASRLGRVCMASITMGSLIAAHLTGASQALFPAVAGGAVYTLARGLANVFIPLPDNAGPANAATTGVSTVAYGAAQFFLAEVGQLAPLSGPARAAAELGHNLGADAIRGVLNGLGVVLDDVISIMCKSCHLLAPNPGLDSVFSDPQALQQMALEVRAKLQLPTGTQLVDALLDIGALRLSVGHSITMVMAVVTYLLSSSDVDDGDQGHVMSGCLALMSMIIYFPLIFGIAKRTDNAYALQETPVP